MVKSNVNSRISNLEQKKKIENINTTIAIIKHVSVTRLIHKHGTGDAIK